MILRKSLVGALFMASCAVFDTANRGQGSILDILGPYGNNRTLNQEFNYQNSEKIGTYNGNPRVKKRPKEVRWVFKKDYKDRNDHSKDYDKVSERSARAAFIMSYVVILFSVLSLLGLYVGHVYYRRKIERRLYLQEQKKILAEIKRPTRYTSFVSGLAVPGVTTDEALRPPTPPPDVEKWNSLLHLFWRFKI